MISRLQLLVIEDSKSDFLLLQRALLKEGLAMQARRVESADEMEAALTAQAWNAVLCDVHLPSFGADQALAIYRAHGLDIPFIVVSGYIVEEEAVTLLKAGAHDFVKKDNLSRLVPALRRELRETADRRRRRQAEERLRLFQAIVETSSEAIAVSDPEGRLVYINPAHERLFKHSLEQARRCNYRDYYPPESVEELERTVAPALARGDSWEGELDVFDAEGRCFPLWERADSIRGENGELLYAFGLMHDETNRKEAENTLRRERDLLARIMETSPAGITVVDRDGQLVFANRKAEQVLGLRKDTLAQRSYNASEWRITDYDGHSFPDEQLPFVQVMRTGEAVFDVRHAIEWPDGRRVLLSINATPLFDDKGETDGMVASVEDVTQRVRAQQHAAQLATVVEQAPVTIVITDLDANIIYANPYFQISTGYQVTEVLGQNSRILQSKQHDQAFYREMWDTLTAGRVWYGHLVDKRKEGDLYHEAAAIFPLKNEQGEIVNYAGVKRNITRQVEAEEALRKSEQRYRLLLESIADGVFVLDREWCYTIVNDAAAEFVQMPKAKLVGGKLQELFPELEKTTFFETMRSVMESRQPGTISDQYRFQDGRESWYEVFIYPVPEGILCISTDISARKRAETELHRYQAHLEELVEERTADLRQEIAEHKRTAHELMLAKEAAEAANRAKSIFLANMSHELRTPLNAILGFSELMAEDSALPSKQRKNIGIVNRAGKHLLAMINDVLDLSKIEAGKAELKPEVFDLARFFEDLAEMFRLRAQGKDLDFHVELDAIPAPAFVKTDQGKLRQVLINLLGNALKFTRHGGITLRVTCVPWTKGNFQTSATEKSASSALCELRVEVEDTGMGIDSEELEHIFEPFTQAASSRYIEAQGTGLGLMISRAFIEMMGGAIEAESSVNKGSCFRFGIPLEAGEERVETQARARIVGLQPEQTEWRILVVDDNEDNQALLAGLLEPIGFALRKAYNGLEALELFQSWSPHFIWLDMRMPVMDGYEAARRIRVLPGGEAVKIAAITATALHEQESEILAAGCDEIVKKPYTGDEIYAVLERLLGVRYRYAESAPTPAPAPAISLHAEDLAQLPRELLETLLQAVLELDRQKLRSATDRIREQDPIIADAIQNLADKYRYEQLMKLCEQALGTRILPSAS